MEPYTLIGAGGAIGTPLAEMLLAQGKPVRLLSRSGKTTTGAESRSVDVLNRNELTEAVRGSKVAFLLVGLEYKTKVWQAQWPQVMENVIEACKATGVPLIFFDNVYMYGPVDGPMTESTPYRPASKKGAVRAEIATRLMNAVQKGELKAMIARSADFYGPHAGASSGFYVMALKNLAAGKKPQWFGDVMAPHTFSYTLDCTKALILLAEDSSAWNQTWHLPSANPAPVPADLISLAAKTMNTSYKGIQLFSKGMLRLLGIFIPVLKEFVEMMYQYDRPYLFDSTKFETHFQFKPTSYEQGMQETVAFFKLRKS